MKSFASRYLLLVAFSLLLGACQSTPPAATEAPDARATAIAQLEQSLASSELATAENQLAALQAESPNDQSLEQYQRQLAEAYLLRSQIVLQKGDVNAAATALARARVLMPKAPALTGGVNGAIAQARKAELEKAEAHHLEDCIECGACAYVCPSHIPLVQYYRFAKGSLDDKRRDDDKSDRAKVRFERRKDRMAAEEAEKEAREGRKKRTGTD